MKRNLIAKSSKHLSTAAAVTGAVTFVALIMSAGSAAAQLKYENKSDGSVSLYGWLNPAYQRVDDGFQSYNELTDNTHAQSRVGLWVDQPTGAGLFQFNFETAIGAPPSATFSQTNSPTWSLTRTAIRKLDVSIQTERAGKFFLGQGSMSTDGVAEIDLSGTTLNLYSSIGDTAGSYEFRTTAGALSGISIGSVMPNLDGARRGRIRYDSPSFNGFTASAAYGEEVLVSGNEDKFYDVALKYGNDFNGTKVSGAIGWARKDISNGGNEDDVFGSIGVLLQQGFNFTIAAGDRDTGGSYGYGKVGYIGDWWSVGKTALAVDYYSGSDFNVAGSSSDTWGIGAVQTFDDAKVDAYVAYRSYDFADGSAAYAGMSSFFLGARWRF